MKWLEVLIMKKKITFTLSDTWSCVMVYKLGYQIIAGALYCAKPWIPNFSAKGQNVLDKAEIFDIIELCQQMIIDQNSSHPITFTFGLISLERV